MRQNNKIQLFEDKHIQTAWNEEKEEWLFFVVDVVAVLTGRPNQRRASNCWAKLKQRLKEEGADQLLTNYQQLKLKLPKDGKRYLIDVADQRLIDVKRGRVEGKSSCGSALTHWPIFGVPSRDFREMSTKCLPKRALNPLGRKGLRNCHILYVYHVSTKLTSPPQKGRFPTKTALFLYLFLRARGVIQP